MNSKKNTNWHNVFTTLINCQHERLLISIYVFGTPTGYRWTPQKKFILKDKLINEQEFPIHFEDIDQVEIKLNFSYASSIYNTKVSEEWFKKKKFVYSKDKNVIKIKGVLF